MDRHAHDLSWLASQSVCPLGMYVREHTHTHYHYNPDSRDEIESGRAYKTEQADKRTDMQKISFSSSVHATVWVWTRDKVEWV